MKGFLAMPMDCQACEELLAGYRLEVNLFRNTVNIPLALGDDSRMAIQEMDRLRQKCKDANDALLAHLRLAVCGKTKPKYLGK